MNSGDDASELSKVQLGKEEEEEEVVEQRL